MRKIEQRMLQALREHRDWKEANTWVTENGNVYLHGNHIARWYTCAGVVVVGVNESTLLSWPTKTTVSRLRALGANVYVRDGIPHINNYPLGVS